MQVLTTELKRANFLVLVETNGLDASKSTESEKVLFKKGSTIKFLNTFDENNNSFIPLFTDWNEIDLWIESRENIVGWIMSATEAFNFVLKGKNYGLVINPCSDRWAMNKEQITDFLKEV